ncbi:nibrin-like [Musca vetustissima]|uniref:nibrin-like n=1 Tax=Musca vetustissima TaxID=27455 RepID=UPI002AB7ABAE|nr:nibrin-like [Musca vetustissima]
MWFMTHTTSGDRFYLSNDKPKYTVGRVGTDLELQNDNCVSRSHAVFYVTESENETFLELEDMGSKYGTYINKDIEKNAPLPKGVKTRLKNNDIVRFGRLQNIWKIQQLNIITITSALTADENAQFNKNIKSIGAKVLHHWSPVCTHLTMNTPSVTVKLLHALIDQTHIVTTKYWEDLAKAVAQRQPQLPKPELYRPPFDESDVDVRPKPQRRTIFNGLTFIFLCRKHYDMYGPIVRAAGGACKEITSGVQKNFLIKNNVVVIQYIPSTQSQSSQTINEITEILESHSKRIIPEYEIGLAIIKCSTQENCNPLHKVPESVPNTVGMSSADLSGDANTQSMGFAIPETNVNLVTSTPYDLAPANDSEDMQETMPNMHISETPVEQPKKRKIINVLGTESQDSDDEELFQFPKKTCNRNSEQEKVPNTSNEEQQQAAAKGARPIKRSMFSSFNDNSESNNKVMRPSSPLRNDDGNATTSTNRKRPHIQVLGEDDDDVGGDGDDLFCFGDTQTSKKKREDAGNDDDLFAFKDSNKNDQSNSENGQNEDSYAQTENSTT